MASQTEVHTLQRRAMLAGDGDGITVGHDGLVQVGKSLVPRTTTGSLPSGVVSMAEVGGVIVVATAGPGKLWRVEGDKPVAVATFAAPLVTGLVAIDAKRVFALRSPSAGAVIVDIATGKQTEHTCDNAKLLLAAASDGASVLAVGGGDEGTVVRFTPGKPACEVVATTQEAVLRSLAVATVAGKKRIIVGGAEEGLVYELVGKQLVALADAAAEEVTGVAITAGGVVFAAAVDSDGKLSKMAAASKDSDDDDAPKKKKPQARRVKASEVWRIEAGGDAAVVWQSKTHGIYAMSAVGSEVWFGSGGAGRLYRLDERPNQHPVVLDARDGVDEITALAIPSSQGLGLLIGTAHAAGVWQLSPAAEGVWTSGVLDMDVPARLGSVRIDGKGSLKISMRTGNTSDPKQSPSSWSSWSSWSAWQGGSIEADGTHLNAATASRYAQVRIAVSGSAEVRALYVSYLRQNRAPEIVAVDVLAPGWKLVASPREGPETRSVSLNERPFNRFLDRAGAQLPKLDERPYAKQSFDVGFRTVYAFAEDDDKDALRYRFSLARLTDGKLGAAVVIKDWSEEPFWSAEASRLTDGQYAVVVDVDDAPSNGPSRMRSAQTTSASFVVSHVTPRVQGAAVRTAAGMMVELDVDAALPLVVVRCTTGLADWLPLDPIDGMLDNRREKLKAVLPMGANARGASCEIYDEGVNFARIELLAK